MARTLRYWLVERKFFALPEPVEYIEPTPEGRRGCLLRRGVLVVVLAMVFIATNLVTRHIKALPDCDSIPWLRGVFIVPILLLAAMSIYGFWLSSKMLRHGQWPLPGTLVLMRRPVQRGPWLFWRARGLFASSVLAAGAAIAGGFLLASSPVFAPPVPDSKCARIEAARAMHSMESSR